jgi:hypothetical protein
MNRIKKSVVLVSHQQAVKAQNAPTIEIDYSQLKVTKHPIS